MARRVIRLLTSRDVFTNLAAEERLFLSAPPDAHGLLFYVNDSAVVIGRTQNPFYECDVALAAATHVSIARRRSGGGTVVHDAGNLNFCFTAPRDAHDPPANSRLIVAALQTSFGITADVTKRGDIVVAGRKVSGAAFRLTRDRAYHHGTLLVHSDLPRLRALLKSPLRAGMRVTGAQSVSSPVANLADHTPGIDIPAVVAAIADRFAAESARSTSVEEVSSCDVDKLCTGTNGLTNSINNLDSERSELVAQEWVYGQIPRFSYTVPDPASIESSFSSPQRMLRVYMSKGGVIHSVRSLYDHGAAREEQRIVSAGIGAVPGDGEGEEEPELSEILAGVLFEGGALAAIAGSLNDRQLQRSVRSLALHVPSRHVVNAS
jgi:lipoate---protein ligase